MSDYEGDDWDRVDYTSRGPDGLANEGFSSHAIPQGQSLQDIEAEYYGRHRNRESRRARLAQSFHPKIQSFRPVTHHATGGRPIHHVIDTEPHSYSLPSYKRSTLFPHAPDRTYELDRTWTEFGDRVRELEGSNNVNMQRKLDNMSVYSQAFIVAPDPHTNKLLIWGSKEQCDIAIAELNAWDMSYRALGSKKKHQAWHKEKAFDGRREHRLMQDNMKRLQDDVFYQLDDSEFEFEAYLVWPIGYDLDGYLKAFETTVLADISTEFKCRFSHEKKNRTRFTKIQAMSEENLLCAYQRLINLVKEMTTDKFRGTHGNLFRVPSIESYKDKIVVAKDSSTPTFTMTLTGEKQAPEEQQDWERLIKVIERRNRKELRTSLDSFFRSLHVSQSRLRMRIEFGDINLVAYDRTSGVADTFATDDFLEMLQDSRTKLSDPILRAKGKNMHHLADVLNDMDQFHSMGEEYRVLFEFQSTNNASRLCLESEFLPAVDKGESEPWAKRWLTSKATRDKENVLGLKVVDLDKPSFMIRVDCYELFSGSTAQGDMHAFQEAIRYKPALDGLKASPRRRVIFPPGNRDLVSVMEATAMKFRFKDTDGCFELRREDIYDLRNLYVSPWPSSSRWVASFYYDRWDSLLDDYGNIKAGEQVKWPHELATFFPETADPIDSEPLPKGFKNFIREITSVQELLKEALMKLPDLHGPGHVLQPQEDRDDEIDTD